MVLGGNARVARSPLLRSTTVKAPRAMAFTAQAPRRRCEMLESMMDDQTAAVGTYGGLRWSFQCPRTYRKITKLYLPNAGWHFWSRQAYRLGYACQREGRFLSASAKGRKLNGQLGGDGWSSWDTPPEKPKWMRWRTYEKKYDVWERAVEEADAEFTVRAARLLKWL
jgi:hypothetical protein